MSLRGPLKTLVALPVHENMSPHFMCATWEWLTKCPNVQLLPNMGDSHIDRSRNNLAAAFLNDPQFDELLFIDSDVLATADNINRIRTHNVAVVGGVYFIQDERFPARAVVNASAPACPVRLDGLQPHNYVGTGFILIKRRVLELMVDKLYDDLWYTPDCSAPGTVHFNFFGSGICKYPNGGRRWLSEDWMFCQRCHDLGIEVFADTTFVAPHRGPVNYPTEAQRKDPNVFPQQVAPPAPVPLSGETVLQMAHKLEETAQQMRQELRNSSNTPISAPQPLPPPAAPRNPSLPEVNGDAAARLADTGSDTIAFDSIPKDTSGRHTQPHSTH